MEKVGELEELGHEEVRINVNMHKNWEIQDQESWELEELVLGQTPEGVQLNCIFHCTYNMD